MLEKEVQRGVGGRWTAADGAVLLRVESTLVPSGASLRIGGVRMCRDDVVAPPSRWRLCRQTPGGGYACVVCVIGQSKYRRRQAPSTIECYRLLSELGCIQKLLRYMCGPWIGLFSFFLNVSNTSVILRAVLLCMWIKLR